MEQFMQAMAALQTSGLPGIVIVVLTLVVCAYLGMLLAGLDRKGQHNNAPWKIAFALLFTLTLFLYAAILWQVLIATLGSVYTGLLPLGLIWLLAIGCFVLKKSLIPKDVSLILGVDRERRRRLTKSMVALTAMQLALFAWLLWLWFRLPACMEATRWGLVAFTTVALLFDGYFFRLSMVNSFDWVKALIDQQYQRELLDFMQIIREQRHDFNLHLQTVAGLVDQQRYGEARAYVDTLVGKVSKTNELLPIRNPAVSALVHTFVERAAQESVRLDVRAEDSMENIGCSVYEMNTVIGNLLKNAIEEVRDKDPDLRYIRLVLMHRSRYTVIRVSNPCDKSEEALMSIFSPGYTTKKSHEGIGLVSVRKICVKYGGTVYIEQEQGVLHVIAKIPRGSQMQE